MPQYALFAVLAVNLVTFAAFGIDKWKARTRRRRIPELHLVLLSWATGLFGGWIAMHVFRHKTSKSSFQVKMAVATALNLMWPLIYFCLE